MNISVTDARALFTSALADVFRERNVPTAFFRSFFQVFESMTKTISLEVQRTGEQIAVDVVRGSEGNRNSFSKSTYKQFLPPFFHEWFDATELDIYDQMFGAGNGTIDSGAFTQFVLQAAEKMQLLVDMIDRSYEIQCAQVLHTGIVTLNSGDNINYYRKAASLVDEVAAGRNYWSNNSQSPIAAVKAGCDFLRQVGRCGGGTFNMIVGAGAYAAMLNNTSFQSRNDLVNLRLDAIAPPQRNAFGAVLNGRLVADSYDVNVWTYPQFYDAAVTKTSTPYMENNKIILLPENPRFKMAFAAVPQLLPDGNDSLVVKKGAYVFDEYKDKRRTAHVMDVKSAGVPIPVAVDQIYTAQVIA